MTLKNLLKGQRYPIDIIINDQQYTVIDYDFRTSVFRMRDDMDKEFSIDSRIEFTDAKIIESPNAAIGEMKFESGAIRSADANATAYHLISPIGLKEVAKMVTKLSPYKETTLNINAAIGFIYDFLESPPTNEDCLTRAAIYLMFAANDNKDITLTGSSQFRYDLLPIEGMKRLAETYAEGAQKYGDYNWELGMPVHDLLNHALRHCFLYLEGDRSENHFSHAIWNCIAAIHSLKMWPELNTPFLRGSDCTITDAIKTRLNEGRKKKNG